MGLEFGNKDRPESNNLLGIYSILSGLGKDKVKESSSEMGWGKFKPILTDVIINALEPIQKNYNTLINDSTELDRVLAEGKNKAEEISESTLKRVKNALGFLN